MLTRPELGDAPYCGNCGYNLTGLTESSKCPECGKPLIEVLTRNPQFLMRGKRWRSRARLFGWPVIDIAVGPQGAHRRGVAKGIIAIGDIAIGGVAIGGMSIGVVALGGLALGGFALGGLAVAAISAIGGGAVGCLAAGGMAIGVFALGGQAIGYMAIGGNAFAIHGIDGRGFSSPEARELFAHSLVMPAGRDVTRAILTNFAIRMLLPLLVACVTALTAIVAVAKDDWARDENPA